MSKKIQPNSRMILLLAACIVGCQSDSSTNARHVTSSGNQQSAAAMPNIYVNLDQPSVTIDDGNTVVSGAVRRKPGVKWLLAGRVDIEFVAADGEVLDQLPALISPSTISMDPNKPSVYYTSYGYVAPSGSTVRVHFVDSDTQAREDLDGFEPDAGVAPGNGAPVAVAGKQAPAAKHGNGGANHYGHGGAGFGGGFGNFGFH